MKKFMLLSLFFATSAYAQVGVGSLNERSVYDIGTGLSVSYFNEYVGVNVESIHLFRNVERPFDNAFLKIGMGANINYTEGDVGFNLLASAGYLYVQDQYHEKSILSKFGTGITADFSYISISENDKRFGAGITLYVVVNKYFVGLGGGVIIPESKPSELTPYINTSFALAF